MKRNILVISLLLGIVKSSKNDGEQINPHELVPETQEISLDQDELDDKENYVPNIPNLNVRPQKDFLNGNLNNVPEEGGSQAKIDEDSDQLGTKNSTPKDPAEQVLDQILKTENLVANKKPAQDQENEDENVDDNESTTDDAESKDITDDPNFVLPTDEEESPLPESVDWVRKPSKEQPEKSKYDQLIQEEMRERKIMNQQGYEVDSDVPTFVQQYRGSPVSETITDLMLGTMMAIAVILAITVICYYLWTVLFRKRDLRSYTQQPDQLNYYREQNQNNQYYTYELSQKQSQRDFISVETVQSRARGSAQYSVPDSSNNTMGNKYQNLENVRPSLQAYISQQETIYEKADEEQLATDVGDQQNYNQVPEPQYPSSYDQYPWQNVDVQQNVQYPPVQQPQYQEQPQYEIVKPKQKKQVQSQPQYQEVQNDEPRKNRREWVQERLAREEQILYGESSPGQRYDKNEMAAQRRSKSPSQRNKRSKSRGGSRSRSRGRQSRGSRNSKSPQRQGSPILRGQYQLE